MTLVEALGEIARGGLGAAAEHDAGLAGPARRRGARAPRRRCVAGSSNLPGMPSAMERSKGPMKMPSTPSMATISSMCSRQPAVSHWGMSRVLRLAQLHVAGHAAGVVLVEAPAAVTARAVAAVAQRARTWPSSTSLSRLLHGLELGHDEARRADVEHLEDGAAAHARPRARRARAPPRRRRRRALPRARRRWGCAPCRL